MKKNQNKFPGQPHQKPEFVKINYNFVTHNINKQEILWKMSCRIILQKYRIHA